MAPSRKKRTKKKQEDPEDFLSNVRERASKKLCVRGEGECDLQNNIQENIQAIRGLLVVNKEIWDRCKGSLTSTQNLNFLEFQTLGYDTVKVRNFCTGVIQFVTSPKRLTKSFDMNPLMSIPETISSTKSFQLVQPGSIEAADGLSCSLIDFETYFENSLLLHDQVLQPFLETLKSHLGDIQVCLGEIEEWLSEPENTQSFIETTFHMKLDVFQQESDFMIDTKICQKCGNTFARHKSGICPSSSSCYFRKKGEFRKTKEFILMTKRFDGKLEYSFGVNCEEGQESLKKLLDFLESC